MNNITQMQINLLAQVTPEIMKYHDVTDKALVNFSSELDDSVYDVAKHVDHVFAYCARMPLDNGELTVNNVLFCKNPKTLLLAAPVMVKIDGHLDDKQSDTESMIIESLEPIMDKHHPFLFVRSENVDHGDKLVHQLNSLAYACMYVVEMDEEVPEKGNKVWLVCLPNEINKVLDANFDTARKTGHPKTPLRPNIQII